MVLAPYYLWGILDKEHKLMHHARPEGEGGGSGAQKARALGHLAAFSEGDRP